MKEPLLRRTQRRLSRSILAPLQVRSELTAFLQIVKELKPAQFLEIGRFRGETLWLIGRNCRRDARIVSIDTANLSPLHEAGIRMLLGRSRSINLFTADSHAASTLDLISSGVHDVRLDLLFIDGDHSYEGVKMDFEMYSPLVRKGGVVAFHDIAEHPVERKCEVSRFWNEIKKSFRYREIIADPNQGWAGIGVLYI